MTTPQDQPGVEQLLVAQKDHYEHQITLLLADKSESIAQLKEQYRLQLDHAVQEQVQAQLDNGGGADHMGGQAMQVFLHTQSALNEKQLLHLEQEEARRERDESRRKAEEKNRLEKKVREWVTEEKEQVESCNGLATNNVRAWIHAIQAAESRVPERASVDLYLKALIKKTTKGEANREQDSLLRNRGRDTVTAAELLDHMQQAFLGPDEREALKDEVKRTKQGPREEIPAYNRRFRFNVEVAYPNPTEEQESDITNMYLAGLKKGRVQDRLFDRDPRLQRLAAATDAAFQEWARLRHKDRVLHEHKALAAATAPEPMEIDALTARETIAAQEKRIRELEAKSAPQNPGQGMSSSSMKCYFCNVVGHLKKDCLKRKAFWERKGGEPRPLAPEARLLN